MKPFMYKRKLILKIVRYLSSILMVISIVLLVVEYYIYSFPGIIISLILFFRTGYFDFFGEEENEESERLQRVHNTKHYMKYDESGKAACGEVGKETTSNNIITK